MAAFSLLLLIWTLVFGSVQAQERGLIPIMKRPLELDREHFLLNIVDLSSELIEVKEVMFDTYSVVSASSTLPIIAS